MEYLLVLLSIVIMATISADILNDSGSGPVSKGLISIFFILAVAAVVVEPVVERILKNHKRKYKKLYYSADMLKDKDIINSEFRIDAKFEKDEKLFQNLDDSSLYRVSLPREDYSSFDFSDVDIVETYFTEDSILPSDSELFQKIRDKDLEGTVLPEGDYRKYNFNDVYFYCTKFTKNSRLSDKNNFFQNIRDKSLKGLTLPSYEARNFHLYKTNGLRFDKFFLKENNINKYQFLIIKNKKCKKYRRLDKSYFD